ncbi:class I SAM-dependent DNA methyltransferase [Thalassospira sp. MIT1370]|uniref:HsdM family class I SAM-dependent methyltransferase n=1 Tax=unclassified Thalassospira TaxID=2648997 RepID=UPI00399A8D04
MIGMINILDDLGADRDGIRLFHNPAPELLAYSTILMARESDDDLRLVEGVYEWQGCPLVFLVDGDRLNGDLEQLKRIRRILAMRGDAPYLGVVFPGRLDVYRIALDRHALSKVRVDAGVSDDETWLTLPRLANLRPAAEVNDRTWITGVILKLLDQAISSLKADADLSGEDAISLVGRALFMRFLADRGLLPSAKDITGRYASVNEASPEEHELFDQPDLVRLSCLWLDKTFNGELLPLSNAVFPKLTLEACHVLGNILRRAEGGQLSLGWREQWDNLDFSHIPVGVLSQAYEYYLRKHAPKKQQQEGGFYTPHPIANLMVSAAFRGLDSQGISAAARILDPAAGAGVFLLAAFRELVAARWRSDGQRPGTTALREILYSQVRGFDINEEALRFCALGLYLLSIELDPNPRPVDKLHFDDLRGVVLHRPIDTTDIDRPEAKQLGSLGPLISKEHDGQYDLVIGNPPWASATGLEDWRLLLAEVHDIARSRGRADIAPPSLPNAVLDLPFVWRAMRWAKPDAQIIFALHARFLFQQGDGMPLARQSLLEALDVTSIINGSELRRTKVWPSISAPFCLLFAVNRPSHTASGFRMLTPRYEKSFNSAGVMRIDAANAYVVRPQDLRERPETLKILFRGSEADLSLIDRVRRGSFTTLSRYWQELCDGELASGNGYQKIRDSSKRQDDGNIGEDAAPLHGLPHLDDVSSATLVIDPSRLPAFGVKRLHRARNRAIYNGPILLVRKSPPAKLQRIQVSVCDQDIVFNESWYGFSAKGADKASLLTRYLALVLGSRVVLWISLITSGEFGFEREVVEKSILEEVMIPPFETLSQDKVREVRDLFARLEEEGGDVWADVDVWVAKLYGLGERDLTIIEDTLRFNLPYASNRELAQSAPSIDQIENYCRTLEAELARFAQRFECTIRVDYAPARQSSPWHMLNISTSRDTETENQMVSSLAEIRALAAVADRTSATEIIMDNGKHRLAILILAQSRYWSETQARLAAQRIIWSRPELFTELPAV